MSASKNAATLSVIAALSLVSYAAQSAPLTSLSATAKIGAQQTSAVQVRFIGWGGGWGGGWRGGWGGGWGWGLGALAAGSLVGAAIASPYYYGGGYYPYYAQPYYGGYPYYGYPAAYYPAYGYGYARPYYYRVYRSYRPYW